MVLQKPAIRARLEWSLIVVCVAAPRAAWSQQAALNGQVSALANVRPDSAFVSEMGLRYIPELTAQGPVSRSDSLALDLSLNGVLLETVQSGSPAQLAALLELYRAWLRFAAHRFETRVGLQKITFGSATLFRPLMWFDRVDPRDPLQVTDGVAGVLARYYFANNANIWAWGLYGNSTPTGWESSPTVHGTVEFGGRVQAPVPAGEIGATFDRRNADLGALVAGAAAPEDRFGLDGKWNLGVGLWGEAALVRDETHLLRTQYQRYATVGADYTIPLGNGVYALTETARFDAPNVPFGSGSGAVFSGLLLNYSIGVVDRLSGIVYSDWQAHQWYRILTWQRTYDMWTFYLLAFWNPAQPIGLGTPPLAFGTQPQSSAFAGRGFQVMAAFNY